MSKEEYGWHALHRLLEQRYRIDETYDSTHIIGDHGEYTVLYSDGREPLPAEVFPEDADAVIFETYTDYVRDPFRAIDLIEANPLYHKVREAAEENNASLYLADFGFSTPPSKILRDNWRADIGQFVAGGMTGIGTMIGTMEGMLSPFQTAAGTALTAGLLHATWSPWKQFQNVAVWQRNAALAYKEEWLLENEDVDHIVTVIDRNRKDLSERLIQYRDDKLGPLESRWRRWRMVLDVIPETLYTISKYEYDRDRWVEAEMFEVPELKALSW